MAPNIRRQRIDSRNAPIKPSMKIIINAEEIIRPIISKRIVSNKLVAGNSGSITSLEPVIIIDEEILLLSSSLSDKFNSFVGVEFIDDKFFNNGDVDDKTSSD